MVSNMNLPMPIHHKKMVCLNMQTRLNKLACLMIADAKEVLQVKSHPTSLWSQAVCHAAWIKNRTLPHSLDSKTTPYQVYFGRKLSLATLQLFGCNAFTHIQRPDQTKF